MNKEQIQDIRLRLSRAEKLIDHINYLKNIKDKAFDKNGNVEIKSGIIRVPASYGDAIDLLSYLRDYPILVHNLEAIQRDFITSIKNQIETTFDIEIRFFERQLEKIDIVEHK